MLYAYDNNHVRGNDKMHLKNSFLAEANSELEITGVLLHVYKRG